MFYIFHFVIFYFSEICPLKVEMCLLLQWRRNQTVLFSTHFKRIQRELPLGVHKEQQSALFSASIFKRIQPNSTFQSSLYLSITEAKFLTLNVRNEHHSVLFSACLINYSLIGTFPVSFQFYTNTVFVFRFNTSEEEVVILCKNISLEYSIKVSDIALRSQKN